MADTDPNATAFAVVTNAEKAALQASFNAGKAFLDVLIAQQAALAFEESQPSAAKSCIDRVMQGFSPYVHSDMGQVMGAYGLPTA